MIFAPTTTDMRQPRRELRYLAGSALCALVNNIVLVTVDTAGAPLIAGVLLTWLMGGITGYLWHSRLTYGSPLTLPAFFRFMTGALFGVPMAWAVLWLLTAKLHLPMWFAGPAATVIMFCYHYANAFAAVHWLKVVNLVRTQLRSSAMDRQ